MRGTRVVVSFSFSSEERECVCVCVCVRERERERETCSELLMRNQTLHEAALRSNYTAHKRRVCVCVCVCVMGRFRGWVSMCVCVCVTERECVCCLSVCARTLEIMQMLSRICSVCL